MYIYPGAHHSQHGWRPPIHNHCPISLVNPFVARLQNPSFQTYSPLQARRVSYISTLPRQQRRQATMEEDWLQNISDLEDITYFNSPVLQDKTGAFKPYLPPTRFTRNEPPNQPVNNIHGLPMSGLSRELTFGSAFGSPKVEDGCSMSDAALDLHGLPAPGYIGRASTPSTTSQPMLVNMRDIHDPISFRGGSMRHGSAPLPSEKTCNDMDALTRSFSTSAPVKLDVSDSGLLAHLDHHFEKQSFEYPNWISRWAEDTSSSPTVHQTLFHHYPLTPTSMVSKESGDDASSVASCGNFTLNSVLCQTPMSTTSNLSMFPVAENGTQKKQVRHKLPTAPTSVPSAATAPATTKTMAKRTRSESSDEELESEDEDGFELDEGCEGRSQPKRRRVQRPPASLAKTSEDEYLLRAREAGMTYKEIKIHGCFSKKESTLRGRYRNLTKNKNDRVRKPQWTNNDVNLLKQFVRNHRAREARSTKVSWKQAANYIAANGGSYHFGNATCRKKWDEIVGNSF